MGIIGYMKKSEGKDKLSWVNRLKLCYFILLKGTYKNMPQYRTEHEQEQWDICRKRDAELRATIRPRSSPKVRGRLSYTDYFERD